MKYFYIVACIFFFFGCSEKLDVPKVKAVAEQKEIPEYVEELETISQQVTSYTARLEENYRGDIDNFVEKYFRPWHLSSISISEEDANWAYVFDNNKSYGLTLQPIEKEFFEQLKENVNSEKFSTLNTKALTLKLLNVRALPTDKPVFLDPSQAGEGFPFDYLQNTSLAPNKPIFISHYSKDKKWAFIECSFGFGWVKSRDIVKIDQQYTQVWEEAEQIFFTKDNETIYDQNGNYLFKSRIGMVLPLIAEDEDTYTVLSVSVSDEHKALYLESKISKKIAHKGLLHFNKTNVEKILEEIQHGKYGWGGIYGQRDCSSTLRDFYTPFGFWLPRNSSVQANIGERVEMSELTNDQKIAYIKAKAVPFKTLVYKKGHIGLYVGVYNDEPIIFQNVWGVKTKKDGIEGRFLIARPIFSSLEVGKNLKDFDNEASMLSQLKSINILFN